MSIQPERPWLDSLRRRSLRGSTEARLDRFERQLRDIENGGAALNLSADSVHLSLEIASFESELTEDQRMALVLVIMISLATLEEGSTRFPVTGPHSTEPMRRMLGALCGEAFGASGAERMRKGIEELLTSQFARGVVGAGPDDYKPLLYLPPFIYQQRSLAAEVQLAKRLAVVVRQSLESAVDLTQEFTRDLQPGETLINLSAEQLTAVRLAAVSPLTIISGGPGTGKTSIILAIVTILMRVGLSPKEIAIAAPTGKAAYRISETIRTNAGVDESDILVPGKPPQAATVHRLLGYSPTLKRFRHHHNNPLDAKVVIVDEASMLDLELMSRLLDALAQGARLILLGDADQLPSVSAGAVFRDLMPAPEQLESSPLEHNCVRLTHSYRLRTDSDAIFTLANQINSGRFATIAIRDTVEQLEFSQAEWVIADTLPSSFLDRWYADRVRGDAEVNGLRDQIFDVTDVEFPSAVRDDMRRIFTAVSRAKILCVTRVLDSGSEHINALLHQRAMREKRPSHGSGEFIAGEPVMVLRNDYDRMLFNGDQGVMLWVRRPGSEASLMAVFPRGDSFVAFGVDTLRQHLAFSYAMTVHKAQGSEFDAVTLVLPDKDIPILSREIMYTAVSRARRSVTVVGSRKIVEAAVARKIDRYSGVREHLERYLNETK